MDEESNLLWKNDTLNKTDAAENKECAGHVSPKTVINLFGVLKVEDESLIRISGAQSRRKQ